MNMLVAARTVSALCVVTLSIAQGQSIDPQLTNTTSFDIPFLVETSDGSQVTGSALLFTSVNGGPLEQTQRVPAAAGEFHFTAPADGLYGFAVRMTDASGQITGDDRALVPELEVIVDTSAPELTIKVTETGPGKIELTWISSDSQVAAGSIRLEYAEGIDGRWKPVATAPSASGSATIETQEATSVSVRGFITDLAGNQGTGTAQIVLTHRASTPTRSTPGLSIPTGSDSVAASTPATVPADTTPGGYAPYDQGSMGPTPFSVPQTAASSAAADYSASSYDVGQLPPQQQQYASHLPTRNTNTRPVTAPGYPAADTSSQANYPTNQTPGYGAAAPYSPAEFSPTPDTQPYDSRYSASLAASKHTPSIHGRSSYGSPSDPYGSNYSRSNSATADGGYPAVEGSPQVVNNRVFDIAYEVQDVGPSGVGSVELFVTENNGQQWFKYGTDADMQSPFPIDSRGEGTFGFAVRVRNGLGFSDTPPQPGERPSIVVTVDQTPPMAHLSPPQIVTSSQGRVRLQWQISDSHPDAEPVRLEYATDTSGPWTPVFDWQQDQGGYEMPIQAGTPPSLHFRLLARDAAGNIATAQTAQPVLIDQRRPTARLLRVQPVSAIRNY